MSRAPRVVHRDAAGQGGRHAQAQPAEERHAQIRVVDEDAVDAGIPDHRPLRLPVAERRRAALAAELPHEEGVLGAAGPGEDLQPARVRVGDDAVGPAIRPSRSGARIIARRH